MTIEHEVEKLQAGEHGWDEFVRRTHADWLRLAASLMRRPRRPHSPGVGVEDVQQELLLWAWISYSRWREDRGQPLHRWMVIGACKNAKNWLNKQRGAKRRSSHAESRFPIGVEDVEAVADEGCSTPPGQVEHVLRREALARAYEVAETRRQRELVKAIADTDGDMAAAIDLLYDDPGRRLSCRWNCRNDVRPAVTRAVRAMVQLRDGGQ